MKALDKELLALFVLHVIIAPSECFVFNVKIGAIFHEGDDHLEAAFDDALRDLEMEQIYPFNLRAVKKRNVELESFKASQVACDLLTDGIAALFGPSNFMTRNALAGIAARFDVPYFEYSYRRSDDSPPYRGINVYPNAKGLEKAIADVVRHMKYNGYTYIYQGHDALSRVQMALENQGREDHPISMKDLPPLSELKQMPERQRESTYETLAKEIEESNQLSLLIDVETENLPKLLENMNKFQLMSDYFMCLITNLDSSKVDVSQYINKTSIANMTYIQFINEFGDNRKYSTEAALLYDSVFVFSDAFHNLYKELDSQDAYSQLQPTGLSCYGQAKYKVGQNLTDMVIKKTKRGRLTGHMTFNEYKERDFNFDVYNVQANLKSKSGEWSNGELKIIRDEKELNTSLEQVTQNKIFKVTTRVGSPYVMESEDEGRLIGIKKYTGYCIDLIAKIEEYLKIKCEFEIVDKYGSYNPFTKTWDGLIKQLLDRKADFAICDLTITSERQSAVDFTAPFMNLGISILFSKPEKVQPRIFSFMDPLTPDVWVYIATAVLVVVLVIFVQTRIAPGEWINPHPCNEDPEELENTFNLENSMWLTIGTLMQQGCDILPRTISVRLLTLIWSFFILIMNSSYTANMAAFLTNVKMDDSINSVEDLAQQTKVSYGALKNGATYSFFKNSNTSLYQRLFNTMADANPTVFTSTNEEGVDRVLKGKRKYAFFMESTTIEYQIERHCELQQVGTLLDNKGYGIALPPNSPYRTMISTAILHLQGTGELQQLKTKWWKEKGGGLCDDQDDEPENANELGIPHVLGVFIVLLLGCAFSIFIGIIQFVWNTRKVAIEEKISVWEALVKEAKFFVYSILHQSATKPAGKSSSKSTSFQESSDQIDMVNASSAGSLKRFNS